MKFLKFMSILNIMMGVLLLILGLGMAIVGTLVITGDTDAVINFFPDSEAVKGKLDVALNAWDALALYVATPENNVPEIIVNLFMHGADKVFAGVGYTLVLWAIVVHLAMTTALVKQISRANEGGGKVSKVLAFATSLLSLIPTLVPGLFMLLASFGKQPASTKANDQQVNFS